MRWGRGEWTNAPIHGLVAGLAGAGSLSRTDRFPAVSQLTPGSGDSLGIDSRSTGDESGSSGDERSETGAPAAQNNDAPR